MTDATVEKMLVEGCSLEEVHRSRFSCTWTPANPKDEVHVLATKRGAEDIILVYSTSHHRNAPDTVSKASIYRVRRGTEVAHFDLLSILNKDRPADRLTDVVWMHYSRGCVIIH